MMRKSFVVAMAAIPLAVGIAVAQPVGFPERGRSYAVANCADCHAVLATDRSSPVAKATRFVDVANTPGMTATAVLVWLQTPHPTMPNFVVAPDDMRDLAAYIVSLKR
ncbi:MAG: cytochrome C [Bauldia sp.]